MSICARSRTRATAKARCSRSGSRRTRTSWSGGAVEMPLRRSRVDALDVISYSEGVARLDLRVGSGTYVRSIATALGGHCATLRRTEVGPFRVEEADPRWLIPADEARARLGPAGAATSEA